MLDSDPARIVYVNGAFVPAVEAMVSVFDRGFLFGDGVYEVAAVLDGKLVDNAAHLARLERSLDALDLPRPATNDEILAIEREIVARNGLEEGLVYLQVTRGVAERSFDWPDPGAAAPTLAMFSQKKAITESPAAARGLRVGLVDDLRWRRRDIKTVNLLPASWAKEQARRAGFDDAWMVEDGFVTEGSSNNAFIVGADGVLRTRHLGHEILHGITRRVTLKLAHERGLEIEERPFTPDEARAAREAFSTSATGFVMPVVAIDGATLGDGAPGEITRALRAAYIEEARRTAV